MRPPAPLAHDPAAPFSGGEVDPFCLVGMFDDLPGVECFVKSTDGRRIRVSRGIWTRLGFSCEAEMLGKKDHDIFPPHIADAYARGDQQILETGKPLLNELEIWINEQGVFDWFLTNKYPIRARNGTIVGIMGTLRAGSQSVRALTPNSSIGNVVEHIRKHFSEELSMAFLAKIGGLSERQLRRRFQQEFSMGIAAFILKTRIHVAADRLLRQDHPISEIALDVGFCDQSAFTRAFRERMGITPREYRLQYAGATSSTEPSV